MSMTTIVEHRSKWTGEETYVSKVRDDLAADRCVCLPCKGRGFKYHLTGHGAGLWSQYSEYTAFCCADCGGRGHWQANQ